MRILIVDDHPDVRISLADFLGQIGHDCIQAGSADEALRMLPQSAPSLLISDLRMPGMDGLALLRAVRALPSAPPVALMTAFGDSTTAVDAMRCGAVDYLRKPIDVRELHRLVERIEVASRAVPDVKVREEADGLIVAGGDLDRLLALADRIHAAPDLPCLIEGETGTGKELFARRVHHGGEPCDAPFVALNCTAISAGLFESELFGYAPGAFTGANPRGASGKIAAAAGGTLFLDEIGDLPLDQQAKLLRLLEDRSWYPVGDNKLRRLQARIICATNAKLVGRILDGRFREDLYYRMKVCNLRIPPLRERSAGALPLARALLERAARRRSRNGMVLTADAEQIITTHRWPGNVRQLAHALEQACLLANDTRIDDGLLRSLLDDRLGEHPLKPAAPATTTSATESPAPAPPPPSSLPTLSLPQSPPVRIALDPAGCNLDSWNRALVAEALRLNNGSPVRASTYLGVTRKVLYTLRKRYGLFEPDDRDEE